MKPISLTEISAVLKARPLGVIADGAAPAISVCTDSRHLDAGCLFFALHGPRFDGHHFLVEAASKGAVAAVIDQVPPALPPDFQLLKVENTRAALGELSATVRRQMTATVVAVAGSNGKTSTKHLIDSALGVRLNGSISPKSYNNDIGVPLTIFPADPHQDYLVLEIGTNHPGEIRTLTQMARPDIAVITNCGPEHLEFLDDLRGVRQENASIIEGLGDKGTLVVNGDDAQLLEAVAAHPRQRTITFGFQESNDLFATDVRVAEEGVRFKLNKRREVFVPLLGRHTASNALAAIAVARRMGLTEEDILAGLSHARGADMRLQLREAGGIRVLNDAYNANPASMKAALETIAALPTSGRKIAVLGDMLELGRSAERFHREIGEAAAQCGLDLLICVGEQSTLMAEAAGQKGMADRVHHFRHTAEAKPWIKRHVRAGDLVLFKASRGVRLEEIADELGKSRRTPRRVR